MEPPQPQTKDRWAKALPASSVDIRTWSYGIIETSELLDVRTERFHVKGLFSERIFGPICDYRCTCGKYQHAGHVGIVCDECGVLVGSRGIRHQRFGHIELKLPVIHPWWYGSKWRPVELLTGLSVDEVRAFLKRELAIQFDYETNEAHVLEMPLVGVDDCAFDEKTEYVSGARAIREWLMWLKDDPQEQRLRECYDNRKHLTRTELRELRQLSSLRRNKVFPEELVLETIPVIPPALRRIDLDDDGRLVVDPVTRCYQRIVSTDRAIRRLLDNERVDLPMRTGPLTEPLCGLERRMRRLVKRLFAELLAGSNLQGGVVTRLPRRHFFPRRRLWPGVNLHPAPRARLVPDPTLHIDECRIPPDMAYDLWAPRLFSNIHSQGRTRETAIDYVKRRHWLARHLANVMYDKKWTLLVVPPVDRLGRLLALKTRRTTGNAVHVHPWLANLFGTTFDGMSAVGWHYYKLGASKEINGMNPRQAVRNIASRGVRLQIPDEALLGCFLATWEPTEQRAHRHDVFGRNYNHEKLPPTFLSADDARIAYESGKVGLTDPVVLRLPPQSLVADSDCHSAHLQKSPDARCTTLGRVLLNGLLPESVPYLDLTVGEREAEFVVTRVLETDGANAAMRLVERLTRFGFEMLTRSGLSLSIADFSSPPEKEKHLAAARNEVATTQLFFDRGILCSAEVHGRTYEIWSEAKSKIANDIYRHFDEDPSQPLRTIVSGLPNVRRKHIEQLRGMLGPVPGFHDSFPYMPITGNFAEGLKVQEYFVTAGHARSKRVSDVLTERDAGRLMRRLNSAIQNLVVTEADCETHNGICKRAPGICDHRMPRFADQIAGRVSRETVVDPYSEENIVVEGELITFRMAERLEALGIERLDVRSPLGCTARRGICQSCYGVDPRTGELVERGTAIGMLSAFAIGELLPQLRVLVQRFGMLPTHGTIEGEVRSQCRGTVSLKGLDLAVTPQGERVTLAAGTIELFDDRDRLLEELEVPTGAVIVEAAGNYVGKGTVLARWNPSVVAVYARAAGSVALDDLIPGRNMHLDENAATNGTWRIDVELRGRRPRLRVEDIAGKIVDFCFLPKDSRLYALPGQHVDRGTLLAHIPTARETALDWYVGGLPRVEELLLAREPQQKAVLAEVDGVVEVTTLDANRCCTVWVHLTDASGNMTGDMIVHPIELTQTGHLLVAQKDRVKAGDCLTSGERSPRDVLKILGQEAAGEHLVFELQKCFRGQANCIDIDDRHFELIVSEMLCMVRVEQPGDTGLVRGDMVLRSHVALLNEKIRGFLKVEKKGDSFMPEGGLVSQRQFDLEVRRLEQEGGEMPTHSVPWPTGVVPILIGLDRIAHTRNDYYTVEGLSMTQQSLALSALMGRRYNLKSVGGSVATGELVPCGTGWQDEDE